MFVSVGESSRSGIQPLLPDDFGDEALAGLKFAEEFGNRYGTPHPGFFPGSLNDAISESCTKPASERKMLAVYLHHDSSVLTNVFCTQVNLEIVKGDDFVFQVLTIYLFVLGFMCRSNRSSVV